MQAERTKSHADLPLLCRFPHASAILPCSRNLAVVHCFSFSKLAISALHETDGKGTVSKVDYFFDSPASFRKLEIEPIYISKGTGNYANRKIVYSRIKKGGMRGSGNAAEPL